MANPEAAIPEVERAVGKLGRAETPLDPAPVSMFETVINYKSEYIVDRSGKRLTFRYDRDGQDLARRADGTWTTILPSFGYMAGMPREMSVPLPDLPAGCRTSRSWVLKHAASRTWPASSASCRCC